MRFIPTLTCIAIFPVAAGGASPIVSYEANTYPELDSWIDCGAPPSPLYYTRSIVDSVLTINTTSYGGTTAQWYRVIPVNADNTCLEWRGRVDNDDGYNYTSLRIYGSDVASQFVVVWRANGATATYSHDYTSANTTSIEIPLNGNDFHTFRLESDGPTYTFLVDDLLQATFDLQSSTGTNYWVQFGFKKDWSNIATCGEWDYLRVGVVPEPATLIMLLLAAPFYRLRAKHRV